VVSDADESKSSACRHARPNRCRAAACVAPSHGVRRESGFFCELHNDPPPADANSGRVEPERAEHAFVGSPCAV